MLQKLMLAKFFVVRQFLDYLIKDDFMFDFAFALTGVPAILFASIRVLIDSGATKCECDMGMRPITKFLFKLIYNGNILSAFRKVIQSLSYSEIEIIKDFGIKFRKKP